MKVEFSNTSLNTTISISDNSLKTDSEIIIECNGDGVESWHSFKILSDLDAFIEHLEKMRDKLKEHLSG